MRLPILLAGSLAIAPATAQTTNLALAGTATQSTTTNTAPASRAIDGATEGTFTRGSVTHTANAPGQWWEVVLPAPNLAHQVRIYNRSDCCSDRLGNFMVTLSVGGSPTFTQSFHTAGTSVPAGGFEEIDLGAGGVPLDTLRIDLLGPSPLGEEVLSLAEVQILQLGGLPDFNLARFGVATQSSVGSGGVPERAIDGNTDGYWYHNSVTHTTNAPGQWWEVALPSRAGIDVVKLYNRGDCCYGRLSNFRVTVWDGATQVFLQDFYTAGGQVGAAPEVVAVPAGTTGDRVRVEILGLGTSNEEILALAEVQVIGFGSGIGADLLELSAASGGTQTLSVEAGLAHAGQSYFVTGSLSGSAPGFNAFGHHFPLNPDFWTSLALSFPNAAPFANLAGTLDPYGRATGSLTIPAGITALVGATFNHLAFTFHPAAGITSVTNAVPLRIGT